MRKPVVAVIGASRCSHDVSTLAEQVGEELANRGAILICGGLGGVMEAACRGAKQAGGTTIGVLPGSSPSDANEWVDYSIATGMGEARNAVIIRTADAAIAISGSYGTLSEIAYALNAGIPVVGITTWEIDAPIIKATDPGQAVDIVFERMRKGKP